MAFMLSQCVSALDMNANSGCDIDAQVNDGRSYTMTRSSSSFTFSSLVRPGIPASYERLWLERCTRHKVRPHFNALMLHGTYDYDKEEHKEQSGMLQKSYDVSNHNHEAMRSARQLFISLLIPSSSDVKSKRSSCCSMILFAFLLVTKLSLDFRFSGSI